MNRIFKIYVVSTSFSTNKVVSSFARRQRSYFGEGLSWAMGGAWGRQFSNSWSGRNPWSYYESQKRW